MECSEINTNQRTKHAGGAPTLYKQEYNEQAYKLCLLGATDEELAEFFNISESTLNEWKLKYPKLSESIRAGKTEADAEIASSLYHAAKGYEHAEDVIMQYQGQPVIVPTVKHYAPDTKAASLWLRNRRPDKWQDQTHQVISGTVLHQLQAPDDSQMMRLAARLQQHEQAALTVPAEVIEAKTEQI